MWPEWSRSASSGVDRYGSDEEEGSSDTQRRKRRTGERSVFDRFIGEFWWYKGESVNEAALSAMFVQRWPRKLKLTSEFVYHHCSSTQRGVILSYSSVSRLLLAWWGPSVVMMWGPQSPASRSRPAHISWHNTVPPWALGPLYSSAPLVTRNLSDSVSPPLTESELWTLSSTRPQTKFSEVPSTNYLLN